MTGKAAQEAMRPEERVMRAEAFVERAGAVGLEPVVLGQTDCGVVVLPSGEGRIFTVLDGEVVSRVVEPALHAPAPGEDISAGGDVLWIAPEGTCYGYFYPEGKWRIPPALCGARYHVEEVGRERLRMRTGPLAFKNAEGRRVEVTLGREIRLVPVEDGVAYETTETVEIRGRETFSRDQVRLAPWTLSQYDATDASIVTYSAPAHAAWIDVYNPVGDALTVDSGRATLNVDGRRRFQVILAPPADQVALHRDALVVSRTSLDAGVGHAIDIRDLDPRSAQEDPFPARMSVFNSDEGFLELEAVGTCPEELAPGTVLSMRVRTACHQVTS